MSKKSDWRRRDPESSREARRYEHPIPSRALILEDMRRHGIPLTLEALAEDFGLRDERDTKALRFRLKAMVRDGQLIQNRRGEYCLLDEIPVLTGTVTAHRDGYGFVALDRGGDDVYLSPREMRQVFHGDRVAVRITGHDRRGRAEGRIVDVLERGVEEIAGRYVIEAGVSFVIPENPRFTHQIVIPEGMTKGAKPGRVVTVEIVEPPTKHNPPIGRVLGVLGGITDPGIETDVAIRSHGLRHRFPRAVVREAEAFGDKVDAKRSGDRYDLRDLPLVTIDGADAKDFDDAVFCEQVGRDFRLFVAIADVSHYVTPGSPLDEEAQARGTSVYFPRRVIPMLPEALSNGLCSLNPDVDRLCMVCEMTVTPAGKVKDAEFYRGIMRSAARMTYKDFYALMWRGDKGLHRKYAHLVDDFRDLLGAYRALAKARDKRGAVDLDIPASRFDFASDGRPEAVVRYTRNDAHRLIEECMIAANVAAARFLLEHKIPALFRNHAPPDEDKVETLRQFLRTVGVTLPRTGKVRPAHYQKVGNALAGRPDAAVLYYMMLRSMSQAQYEAHCEGHFGLALDAYAHFTSPIRRYPDLLVHRAIGHILDGGKPKRYTYKRDDMEALGRQCSQAERQAEEAVRDVESWLKCEVMLDHVGDVFDGKVVSVAEFGLFVEITEMNIEGLLHVTALGHDYFKLDALGHRLVGRRSGQSFELGQALKVQVAGVSVQDRKIDFALAESSGKGGDKKGRVRQERGKGARGRGGKKGGRKGKRRG